MINHPCKFLCVAYFIAFGCAVLAGILDLFNLEDFKDRDWLIQDDPLVNDFDRWDGLNDYLDGDYYYDDYYYESYYYYGSYFYDL